MSYPIRNPCLAMAGLIWLRMKCICITSVNRKHFRNLNPSIYLLVLFYISLKIRFSFRTDRGHLSVSIVRTPTNHIGGLVQERHNSSALRLSCTNPPICLCYRINRLYHIYIWLVSQRCLSAFNDWSYHGNLYTPTPHPHPTTPPPPPPPLNTLFSYYMWS